jgi:hypothetical protein
MRAIYTKEKDMKNPYMGNSRLVMAGSNTPAELELRTPGSTERMVAGNGEVNASDKRDLMKQISSLVEAYTGGKIQRRVISEDVIEARRKLVAEAISDKSGEAWKVLGEVIGDEVWTALKREGFARKTLLYKPLGKNEIGRIRVRQKDVRGFMATTPSGRPQSVIRQMWVYPPEFYLDASPMIEIKEIESAAGDLLEEKYEDALEQIMVAEDRVWKILADTSATVSNTLTYFNTLTPTVFSSLRTQVARWLIPVTQCLLAFSLWDDIIGSTDFSNWFDPVSKYTLITEGYLGDLLGVAIHSDAFRDPNLKVLTDGEIYMCGAPQLLGGITQRSELTAEPIDKFDYSMPYRGWYMYCCEGMAIVNSRAISKGIKNS